MVTRDDFGRLPNGRGVERFTLSRGKVQLEAISWGAIITSLCIPDRHGFSGDVVLGYENLGGYLTESPYFGCVVGRVANRIARARFVLDGKVVHLSANEGENHLHGGWHGFDKQLWDSAIVESANRSGVRFSRASAEGEEGYPGGLAISVQYLLTSEGDLHIDYEANTDAPTIINPTQHSYFNLSGGRAADVLDHRLEINADAFTPVDAELLPTGEVAAVAGTPFDFTRETAIGSRIASEDAQLGHGRGFDHNWVLRPGRGLKKAASVSEPLSGRILDVFTTAPGLQFYSGNQLDGTLVGKAGQKYGRHAGLCLETQGFPDAPNHPHFPSVVLRPGERFQSHTVFRFRCLDD